LTFPERYVIVENVPKGTPPENKKTLALGNMPCISNPKGRAYEIHEETSSCIGDGVSN
jgi:hypothetical protein